MTRSRLITRRRAIVAGLASVGGLVLARAPKELPPTYGHLLRMGDTLTYATHRALLPGEALAREFDRSAITAFPAIGTTDPGTSVKGPLGQSYKAQQAAAFADWRLSVEGLVARPHAFSLAELKQFTSRTPDHASYVRGRLVGDRGVDGGAARRRAAGRRHPATARFAVCSTVDDWVDSMDLFDALHPQTLLAYGMNGRDLPIPHGAPVRLRVERQLGYKSLKFVQRIVVTDRFDDGGASGSIQNGWSWYSGI